MPEVLLQETLRNLVPPPHDLEQEPQDPTLQVGLAEQLLQLVVRQL